MARLPPHSHCLHCDDPVPEGQDYCSEECRMEKSMKDSAEKRKNLIFYGLAAVAMVVVLLLNLI